MSTKTSKEARKPGIAHPPVKQMVAFCVAAACDMFDAYHAIDNAAALGRAARDGMRNELSRAFKVVGRGKPFDGFKADVVAGMLAKKLFAARKAAQLWLNDQVKACGLTGNGNRKGGRRKGAGRKEKVAFTATNASDKAGAWNAAALAYIARVNADYSDPILLEVVGDIATLLQGETLA